MRDGEPTNGTVWYGMVCRPTETRTIPAAIRLPAGEWAAFFGYDQPVSAELEAARRWVRVPVTGTLLLVGCLRAGGYISCCCVIVGP